MKASDISASCRILRASVAYLRAVMQVCKRHNDAGTVGNLLHICCETVWSQTREVHVYKLFVPGAPLGLSSFLTEVRV